MPGIARGPNAWAKRLPFPKGKWLPRHGGPAPIFALNWDNGTTAADGTTPTTATRASSAYRTDWDGSKHTLTLVGNDVIRVGSYNDNPQPSTALTPRPTAPSSYDLFVDASAGSGGDGSESSPFDALGDLYSAVSTLFATQNRVNVSVAAGAYNETFDTRVTNLADPGTPKELHLYFVGTATMDGSALGSGNAFTATNPNAALHVHGNNNLTISGYTGTGNGFATLLLSEGYMYDTVIDGCVDGLSAKGSSYMYTRNVTVTNATKSAVSHIQTPTTLHEGDFYQTAAATLNGVLIQDAVVSATFNDCDFANPVSGTATGRMFVISGPTVIKNSRIGAFGAGAFSVYSAVENTTILDSYLNFELQLYSATIIRRCFGILTIRPRGPVTDTLTVEDSTFVGGYRGNDFINFDFYSSPNEVGGALTIRNNIFTGFDVVINDNNQASQQSAINSNWTLSSNLFFDNTTNYSTGVTAGSGDVTSVDPELVSGTGTAKAGYFGNALEARNFGLGKTPVTRNAVQIEGAATNLLTYSEDFSNAAWTDLDAGDALGTGIATPDTSKTSAALVPDSTDGAHGFTQAVTTTNAAHTLSVYAKAGAEDWLYLSNDTVSNADAYFDLAAGAVGTEGAAGTGYIEDIGDGWYRCILSFTATAASNTMRIAAATADGDADFAGDGAAISTHLFGAQLETGPYATSQIVTTSAAATRAADSLVYDSVSVLADAATLATSFAAPLVDADSEILTISDGGAATDDVAISILNSGDAPQIVHTASSTAVTSTGATDVADGDWHDLRFLFGSSDQRVFVDGVQEDSDTGQANPALDRLTFGSGRGFVGPIKIYDKVVTP